jgi:hypothetical protein
MPKEQGQSRLSSRGFVVPSLMTRQLSRDWFEARQVASQAAVDELLRPASNEDRKDGTVGVVASSGRLTSRGPPAWITDSRIPAIT